MNVTFGVTHGPTCSGGGQHRFVMSLVPVAESDDKFAVIKCAKCHFVAGVENLSTRAQIAELVKSVASFLRKLSDELFQPKKG